ncbi:phosphoesterase RecJ domain-containing protein [Catalinimonas alkaloidigena]|uniref:Phosphoesterase RecJ domain-containing protein n=1 Tax=Catalinimonas alkaloidigena TaxID=1075417 RepID=A0A1G9DP29_9BACT|nr:bifunctional oligoribonuclease/PAP phosphatase NrnA [Catalinimonas alkaloidigena]SDK65623.1 phosphoesterase RecJ domain-containing protein [Catalinimonas alkaloidigena]
MRNFEAFRALISAPKRVVITTHHKPDADALGSSLALANFLKKKYHDVQVITSSDYPRFLHWMQGNEEVIVYDAATNHEQVEGLVNEADIIFCLDFSSLARTQDLEPLLRAAQATIVQIDHHLEPEEFADFVLWNNKASATCELVYDLFDMLDDSELIDKGIAECIYAGILTDTGSFRHPTTSARVHIIVAELIRAGVEPARIHKLIYDNYSENRLRFLGYALSEKLVVLPEYRTAYISITSEELQRFRYSTGDTEGFVNFALSIEGIVVGAVFIEREDAIKISFRSIGDFAVNVLAREHFEGGGHKNAAGGKSNLSIEDTVQKFINLLPAHQEELQNVVP